MSIKKRKFNEISTNWEAGEFVWARPTRNAGRWWPGVIISHTDGGFKKPKLEHFWVFWFGDYRATEVHFKNICSFKESFAVFYEKYTNSNRNKLPKLWKQGVLEALKDYGNITTASWNNDQLIDWALCGFLKNHSAMSYEYIGVPDLVKEKLNKHRDENIKSNSCFERSQVIYEEKDLIDKIKRREICLDSICICCYSTAIESEHPVFYAGVCKNCLERIRSTAFLIGDDNIAYYCLICATLGDMLVCDVEECGRVFCRKCLQNLGKSNAETYIEKQKMWRCLVCDPSDIKNVSNVLQIRSDWQERIRLMFVGTQSKITPIPEITTKRRKLRVLSLFDGIGTGLLALDSLQLPVEKYYSVEIDKNAISVLKMNFGERVTHLGDVRDLNEEAIKKLGPIDLLIGGSPCNDLSFVNPNRKGLYDPTGTGILFFDFHRVLTTLNAVNGKPFFWLYENVASMSIDYRIIITRFLGCEPKLCDSVRLSAHKRARLFWGNLPSLSQNEFPDEGPCLQSYLMPGRTATLRKVNSLTTARNSLEKGAVLNEDNTPDVLMITEIERMFGYPLHYTDTGNISLQGRQKLIGRAWSVHVVRSLFQCLCSFFVVKIESNKKQKIKKEYIRV
ncbi:DNA (cytosine-5)-methyltransferase 3A [Agrilus planipennis]|uniref:DNA (cytosine-5-)-methyltransferase n=1 Tax=Agrilus planipennis TaxID=224129 RepID=A0A1W4WIZ3_AGRPL|nr:DNA (cytosine-5)-methyltransferase 3A [Agrilus planipennis]